MEPGTYVTPPRSVTRSASSAPSDSSSKIRSSTRTSPGPPGIIDRSDRRADAGNALDRRRVSFDARVGIDDAPLDDCVRTDGCVLAETDIRSDDGTRFDDAILIDDDRFTNHR